MERVSTHKCGSGSKKIGELFVEEGLITEEQLKEALEYQEKFGGRLGWILVSLGYIDRESFYLTLARHYCLPFERDFKKVLRAVDPAFIKEFDPQELLSHEVIPAKEENGRVLIFTSYPYSRKFEEFVEKHFKGKPLKVVVITDVDLIKVLEHFFKLEIIDKAIHGLIYLDPESSAYKVFSKSQLLFFYFVFVFYLLWLYQNPISAIVFVNILVQFGYLVVNLFKFIVSLAGAFTEIEFKVEDELVKYIDPRELPVYTILVPAYREPEVIPFLVRALKNLDYPLNKLDVLFLLEEDDEETIRAVEAASPPASWRIIRIPDAVPKTKPKACNYGLLFARGKYLVIYDAEDIPEPDQLKKAVIAFKLHPENYICFQAALNFFNRDENFLTKMFTLEYSYWFDYMLPGLHRLRMIIPLGGTSNHFKTQKLIEIGAWDPFNVTEDADLGVRAYERGYKVGVINSTTYEEANSKLGNWIRQRSRWIKGYMQTWLVHTRHPIRLYRRLGFRGFISFHLLIGGTPFMFLVNPILWLIFIYWLITKTALFEVFFPPFVLYSALFNLLFGNFLAIYLSMLAVFKRKYYKLLPYALLNPIYWILHSIAAYKALYELFTKPYYWQKTQHGITRYSFEVNFSRKHPQT